MAAAYTSAESEIEDRRRRLLHHSAHKMPITAQASENQTMLLPVLNGSEISLTKNPQWKIFPSFGQLNRARQQSASKATRQQPLLGFVCSFVGARMVVKGTASHFQRLIIKEQLEGLRRAAHPDLPQGALGVATGPRPLAGSPVRRPGRAGCLITSGTSPRCAHVDYRPRLGTTPVQPMSEGDAVSDLDRLEAAAGECREMIREAHAATKDLRAAVREAKSELHALTRDEVAAHIQLEVSRQLEELDERTREAISVATQKVIAEFDRFGESLLGKEAYWQKASGRRAATRPDTEVVTLDVQPDQDKG